jgi:hypothetical protein
MNIMGYIYLTGVLVSIISAILLCTLTDSHIKGITGFLWVVLITFTPILNILAGCKRLHHIFIGRNYGTI